MLPPQWDGEEKNIRRTDQRDRTRVILTTSVLNIRRHGHHSNRGIQKTRLTDRWKAGQAIQQDGALATMQTELFTAKIRNHVHSGISLSSPPPSQTTCHWGQHRPRLLWRPGPNQQLNKTLLLLYYYIIPSLLRFTFYVLRLNVMFFVFVQKEIWNPRLRLLASYA